MLANKVLFGQEETLVHKESGKSMQQMKEESTKDAMYMLMDPLSLNFKWWWDLQLLPYQRRVTRRTKAMTETVKEYIDSKEGQELKHNLFDFMIKYNRDKKDTPDEQIPLDDFYGNYLVFLSAGTDTTQSAVFNSINLLGQFTDVQENLRTKVTESDLGEMVVNEVNSGKSYTYEQGTSCGMLVDYMNEVIRYSEMAPVSSMKTLITDCTIGGYNFKKGDELWVASHNHNAEFFPDHKMFNIERFKDMDKWTSEEQFKF